ncbi:TrpR like protein, YerC/YecD [Sphingorhabdus soli]|uniref:TrpR like protein, YerC/YecD n=1 Tax=Flavisphingopyxis soli TaxID=2601267 RepID=A0A5C6U9F2_9SPHN|nr:YerC/YecD family TrpR-related protein [Sphingorhabdus soli]TXC68791.1 TrpR like protein, YerC/YecD [Sphingorhabdus soli]
MASPSEPLSRDLLLEQLSDALLVPTDHAEMAALLSDLCTPAELHSLAERWQVARLLDTTDKSYREIHDDTGVSTTTIVRVARFLKHEPHLGYRRTLDAVKSRQNKGARDVR